MTGFVYLATPYSKYIHGLEAAYVMACQARAELVAAGVPCFSPITHCHGVAIHGGIDPLSHEIWLPAEAPILSCACGLIVYQGPGWRESYGIGKEIEAFQAARKPIVYWEPRVLASTLAPSLRKICGVA